MKIFSRFYVRRLYRANNLLDVLEILYPWIDEVLCFGSPFLRQVASYHLKRFGGSYAPRLFKTIVASEILRLNEAEDLEAALTLSIVEAYKRHDPSKGTDVVNWLSWVIPYELSKLVVVRVVHPIGPFEEAFVPCDITSFEERDEPVRQIGILAGELGMDRQLKHYYIGKLERERNATYC